MDSFYIFLVVGILASLIGVALLFFRRVDRYSDASPRAKTAVDTDLRNTQIRETPIYNDDTGLDPLRGDGPSADLIADRIVSCSAFSPASVAPEATFLASVVVHLPEQADAALALARTGAPDAGTQSLGNLFASIRRGDRISVHLAVTDAETVTPPFPIQLIWTGGPAMARFTVRAPASGTLSAEAVLSVDGTPVGYAAWQIEVSEIQGGTARDAPRKIDGKRFEEVFISYNRKDMDIVRHIAGTLKAAGVRRFLDVDSVPKGALVSETVQKAIADCDLFILLWSENARNSAWVRNEMDLAYARWSTSTPRAPVLHVQARSLPIEGLPEEWRDINYSDYMDYTAEVVASAPNSAH